MTGADAAAAHWGEAAFYMSLDLAVPILTRTARMPALPSGCLAVAREAILTGRNRATRGSPPVSLEGDLRQRADARDPAWNTLFAFVEQRMISFVRPVPLPEEPLVAVFNEDEANRSASRRLGSDMRSALLRRLDAERYRSFLEDLFALDRHLAAGDLTEWDRAILERNADIYPAADPLGNLVATFDHWERRAAIARLGQEELAPPPLRRGPPKQFVMEG